MSVVKHALLDGMSTKAVWDSFDRIKKFVEEAQNTSTNSKSIPCQCGEPLSNHVCPSKPRFFKKACC